MGKMGRPAKDFDFSLLDKLCKHNLFEDDCAEILKVSVKTLERRIKKNFDCTFDEYRNKKMAYTRRKLINKALKMAFDGNTTMLIFALKNLCNWVDKKEEVKNPSDPNNADLLNSQKVIYLKYAIPPKPIEEKKEDESRQEN